MSKRRRQSSRGSHTRAKIWLILIWIVLRLLDVMDYMMVPEGSISKKRMVGAILNAVLWTTVLLIAIAYRQNWARYLVVISLMLGFMAGIIFLQMPTSHASSIPMLLAIQGAVDLAIALVLILSPDIKRLHNPIYG